MANIESEATTSLASVDSKGDLHAVWKISGPVEKINSQKMNISGSGWMTNVYFVLIIPNTLISKLRWVTPYI